MIEIRDLEKTYKGKKGARVEALRGVSFTCRPGEVFGLLGPNGAGKTTALRIVSTALRATGGSGRVMDYDIATQSRQVRQSIGFLSTNTGLYDRLSPREVLTYFGRLFRMHPIALRKRIDELAETFQMSEFLDRRCDKLSTGMKQKVNIARTVIHSPPVMIFDEPTSAMDNGSENRFKERLMATIKGKTLILITHRASLLTLVDRLIVIDGGKVVADGPKETVLKRLAEKKIRTTGT